MEDNTAKDIIPLPIDVEEDESIPEEVIVVAKSSTRWVPKKWKPVYEEIVALNVMGLDNRSLAERYNYTPQQISNILNTPQADIIKKLAIERLRKNTLATVEQRLDGLKLKVVEKLELMLTDPQYFERSPFAVIDRGMKVLEKLGTQIPTIDPSSPTHNGNITVNGNMYVMPNESVDKMTKALDKLQEVKRIHGDRDDSDHGNIRVIGSK